MNDVNVCVRAAMHGDMAGILTLAPRLAEGVAPWRDQAEARGAGKRWLADSLGVAARGDGVVFVAVEAAASTEVTGVISVRQVTHFTGERDGYIGELAVAASAVRQGIGRALVGAAREWAAARGLANLTLHTGAYNTGAREFYAALGFREEEVRLTLPL
jgi:ribosomal protein S18 acetylase RimI-like enzyme